MIKSITLPFLRLFAWVGGWMDGCTNYKTQWQCPKCDREKTMLLVLVRQTFFSKKLHQLSNTGKKLARRKRVCEQHIDTQRWGQRLQRRESTYYIHVPGLTTASFQGVK
jgi:hypothetical protein